MNFEHRRQAGVHVVALNLLRVHNSNGKRSAGNKYYFAVIKILGKMINVHCGRHNDYLELVEQFIESDW